MIGVCTSGAETEVLVASGTIAVDAGVRDGVGGVTLAEGVTWAEAAGVGALTGAGEAGFAAGASATAGAGSEGAAGTVAGAGEGSAAGAGDDAGSAVSTGPAAVTVLPLFWLVSDIFTSAGPAGGISTFLADSCLIHSESFEMDFVGAISDFV